MLESFIDKDIQLSSFAEYCKYTFQCYYLNESIGTLLLDNDRLLSKPIPSGEPASSVFCALTANTPLLRKVSSDFVINSELRDVKLPNKFSHFYVNPKEEDLESPTMVRFYDKKIFNSLRLKLQSDDKLINDMVFLTLLHQKDNPFFINALKSSATFKSMSKHNAMYMISSFMDFHEYNSTEMENSLLFKHFFSTAMIKNLFFDRQKNTLDARFLHVSDYINLFSDEKKLELWDNFLHSLKNNEKFIVHSILSPERQDNLSESIKDKLITFSKTVSIASQVEQLQSISDLNQLIFSKKYSTVEQNINAEEIYSFYKKIFTKKDFPINYGTDLKFSYTFNDLKINVNIKLSRLLTVSFQIEELESQDMLRLKLIRYLEEHALELFDSFIINAYKYKMENNRGYSFFHHSSNTYKHKEILNSFFNKFHETILNEKLDKSDSQNVFIKSKAKI